MKSNVVAKSLPLFKRFCHFWSTDSEFEFLCFIDTIIDYYYDQHASEIRSHLTHFFPLHYKFNSFIIQIFIFIVSSLIKREEWLNKLRFWPWYQKQMKKNVRCVNKQTNFMVMPNRHCQWFHQSIFTSFFPVVHGCRLSSFGKSAIKCHRSIFDIETNKTRVQVITNRSTCSNGITKKKTDKHLL